MPQTAFRIPLIFSFFMLLGPGLASPSAAQEPVTFKMGTLAPEGSNWLETWYEVVDFVEDNAPVPMELKTYPGGVMGDEPDLVNKLKFNQLQAIGVTIAGMGKLVPELLVLSMPFMFESYAEIDYVIKKLKPMFQAKAEERGYYILSILDQGMMQLYSKKKIDGPSDINNQRIWTWPANPIDLMVQKALDLNGHPIGVPEVLPSLQTGLIDTVFASTNALVQLQWFTQINYQYLIDIRYEPAATIASKKTLKKVPEDKRDDLLDLFDRADKKFNPGLIKRLRDDEQSFRKDLKDAGVQTITWSDENMEKLRKDAKQVWDMAVGDLFEQEVLDAALAARDEFRARNGG